MQAPAGTGTTNKMKVCEFCGKEYKYRIHNQKFCSSECRKQAWELKTGTKLKYKSKK